MLTLRRYWSLGILALCVTAAIVFRRFCFVAYYPVAMSAFLAMAFAVSLAGRRPLCLALAETLPPCVLPVGAEHYCRRLTAVWAGVLTVNGLIALATVFAPRAWWFIWNCALSYGFLGLVALIERRVRARTFAVAFHTSGSTAAPKTIVKPFAALAAEVAYHRDVTLAAVLARRPRILATIEPQHMYGTLWRVLLPRAAGCAVAPETVFTPEALVAEMRAAAQVVLVTTPSFLERFCAYAAQYAVPANCLAIITSGAPLASATAAAAQRVFGCVPLEIFGSTETGGVAWRRQDGTSGVWDWEVFAPVRVARDAEGRLVVNSPFCCARDFALGDAVELAPDGRHFKLLGRIDRLVKIAEQRVSLPEMEAQMAALPGVRAAALVPLDGAHGPVLGAVVAPDFAVAPLWGVSAEERFSKRALARALRAKLLAIFPSGAAPRRFRFVYELPRNAQGKVQTAALRRLFAGPPREPFVYADARAPGRWEGTLVFDAEAPYFQGHFPGFPILPGVAQLDAVMRLAGQVLGDARTLTAVKKMKFTGVVRPREPVQLVLTARGENEVAYSYSCRGRTCASGVAVFSGTPHEPCAAGAASGRGESRP